jgi:hypothetical protein
MLKKKAVDDTDKAGGGSCYSNTTAGNIRQDDECGAAGIPAEVGVEYVLANSRVRALERE